jgi:hypothetical protein
MLVCSHSKVTNQWIKTTHTSKVVRMLNSVLRLVFNHIPVSIGDDENRKLYITSYEAFTAVMFDVDVFWVVTPSSVHNSIRRHNPEDNDLKVM